MHGVTKHPLLAKQIPASGRNNSGELLRANRDFALSPHDEPGPQHLFGDGQLSCEPLANLLRRPAARGETLSLGGLRASQTDHGVELRFHFGLEQQRDDHHGGRTALLAPGLELVSPQFCDAGMSDGFQLGERPGILENNRGKRLAPELAGGIFEVTPKSLENFREGGLTGRHDLSCQIVGINHRDATIPKNLGGGGFAHANAAGEAEGFHNSQPTNPSRPI